MLSTLVNGSNLSSGCTDQRDSTQFVPLSALDFAACHQAATQAHFLQKSRYPVDRRWR